MAHPLPAALPKEYMWILASMAYFFSFLLAPSPIIARPCHKLSDWSCCWDLVDVPLANVDTNSKVSWGKTKDIFSDSRQDETAWKQHFNNLATDWHVWSQLGFSFLKACWWSHFGKKINSSVLWLWKSLNNISINDFGLCKIKFNTIRLWTSKFQIRSHLGTHDEALVGRSFTWPRLHDKHLQDVTIAWHTIAWQACAWSTFEWQK